MNMKTEKKDNVKNMSLKTMTTWQFVNPLSLSTWNKMKTVHTALMIITCNRSLLFTSAMKEERTHQASLCVWI